MSNGSTTHEAMDQDGPVSGLLDVTATTSPTSATSATATSNSSPNTEPMAIDSMTDTQPLPEHQPPPPQPLNATNTATNTFINGEKDPSSSGISETEYQQLFANLDALNQQIQHQRQKELGTQKIRNDNRARKKRWREHNQERNKDNDLRCRVNKRAQKLFGKEESNEKTIWVEDEFRKRKQKRQEKEGKRGGSVHDDMMASQIMATGVNALNTTTAALAAAHSAAVAPLVVPDQSDYLALIASSFQNNTAMQQGGGPESSSTTGNGLIKQEDKNAEPTPEQITVQLLDFLHQQQSQQAQATIFDTLAAVMTAAAAAEEEEKKDTNNNGHEVAGDDALAEKAVKDEKESKEQSELPIDAVMTLMKLNANWKQ